MTTTARDLISFENPTLADPRVQEIVPLLRDGAAAVQAHANEFSEKANNLISRIQEIPSSGHLPKALRDELVFLFDDFDLQNRRVADMEESPLKEMRLVSERLFERALYATGEMIVDETGDFHGWEDYAIDEIERRSATIDWHAEPKDDADRALRNRLIEAARSSPKVIFKSTELRNLGHTGVSRYDASGNELPWASDLATAIEAAELEERREGNVARRERSAERRRHLAFSIVSTD